MEKLSNVSGTWRGIYGYEVVEGEPRRDSVPFTLTLRQGWFSRFKGQVTDDSPSGVPGIGSIEGRFSFPRIEFVKRMPVAHVTTPDGRIISLRRFLHEQGVPCFSELPASPIFYEGAFVNAQRAAGKWTIKAGLLDLPDGRQVRINSSRGTWTMESGAS